MNETGKKTYKYCITPLCTNTTISAPEKLFFHLPKDTESRDKWLNACSRNPKDISGKTTAYVCQDHFNLREDMENFIRHQMMGGKLKLKNGTVPHIFDCHDRKRQSTSSLPRTKRKQSRKNKNALNSNSSLIESSESSEDILPSTSAEEFFEDIKIEIKEEKLMDWFDDENIYEADSSANSVQVKTESISPTMNSPKENASVLEDTSPDVNVESKNDTIFNLESMEGNDFMMDCPQHTIAKINKRMFLYLGVPDNQRFIIDSVERHSKICALNIYIVLKKIRTGRTFLELADDFGFTEERICEIFFQSVPNIEKYLRKFIYKPNNHYVKKNLPILFKKSFSKVVSIIDCLEIEIEKPTSAVQQTLTWSEFKKCYTIKYLISFTPDGLINFVSGGFGGKATDAILVERSQFLDFLVPGDEVMAVKGFNHIECLLRSKRNCKLIRLPSVPFKPLEKNLTENLRIHIEKVISRLKEFNMLGPYTCVDVKIIPYMNHIVRIVCGMVNLQPSLIARF